MSKFLKGAAILTIAGILVKIMGAFFRIPLTNWVGADGLSYYSSAYMVYTVLLCIATAGIPTAISRMVAERVAIDDYYGAKRLFKVALLVLAILGFIAFALMFFFSDFIASKMVANPGASLSIKALAPAVFIVPVMAAFRGYFQGQQNMTPTAISQFVEQLVRVGVGLFLAYKALSVGNIEVSAGATFGCSAGALFGLIIIFIIYLNNRKRTVDKIEFSKNHSVYEPLKDLIKELLAITIPITIGACVVPIISATDSVIVMSRLQHTGWTYDEARMLWGRLGGYCDSIINLPTIFITGISTSVLPLVASSFKLNKLDETRFNANSALKIVMMVASPCACGLFALAFPVLKILYPAEKVAQEVIDAVPTLRILCVTVITTALMMALGSILQGIGKQTINLINVILGYGFKILCSVILVGIASINVNGGPIGSIICESVICVLDIIVLKRVLNIKFNIKNIFIKPIIASLIMGVLAYFTYVGLYKVTSSILISTIPAVLVGVVSYVVLVLLFKMITKDEVSTLPKSEIILSKFGRFLY